MIDMSYCYLQFSNLFQEKKNWAALALVNTYFSLALPEFPGQK
jgi:hypothetical protein